MKERQIECVKAEFGSCKGCPRREELLANRSKPKYSLGQEVVDIRELQSSVCIPAGQVMDSLPRLPIEGISQRSTLTKSAFKNLQVLINKS